MAKEDEFNPPSAKSADTEGLKEVIPSRIVSLCGTLRLKTFVIDQLLNCSACP